MNPLVSGIRKAFKPFTDTRTIAIAGMLIALNVILTRFLSIQTPILRIGFGFLPVAVFSMLFGALPGAIAAAMGDVIGFFLFPNGGTFFPGFTFSAFIAGLIFGFFLNREKLSLLRIILANIVVIVVVDICLNTIWLSMLYQQAVVALILPRLIKAGAMLPIQILLIYMFQRLLGRQLWGQLKSWQGAKKHADNVH